MADDTRSAYLTTVTAARAAAARAQESTRDDALISDPLAARLAGEEGMAWVEGRSPESALAVVLRTRYFDDFILRTLEEDGIRQVVIVAAGYDTRAFRLDWPDGTHVFEVDVPEVLTAKQSVLDEAGAEAACERVTIAGGLAQEWKSLLVGAGLDTRQPAVWILEGILPHLPSEQLKSLLDSIMKAASGGSYLAFDVINNDTLTSPLTKSLVDEQAEAGAPWIGVLDDPKEFAKRRGWKVELAECGTPEVSRGRWPLAESPVDERGAPHQWFVTARRPWPMGEQKAGESQAAAMPAGGGPYGQGSSCGAGGWGGSCWG